MLAIIVIGVPVLLFLIGLEITQQRKQRYLYKIIWKNSKSLRPKDILRNRPFNLYYYSRGEDNLIRKSLNDGKNVLVIGTPLAGKSRAIYQALISSTKPYDIIIPNCADINIESFLIPKHHKFWRGQIVLFDDLHRFVEKQNFDHLLRGFAEKNIVIIATCRSGREYENAKNRLLKSQIDLELIFQKNIIELGKISKEVGKEIAVKVKKIWNEVEFDGTVGSVFMDLAEMKKRFYECNPTEKTILRAIKLLYDSGIYKGKQEFPIEWIKNITKEEGLKGEEFEWASWFEKIKGKEFIEIKNDKILVEETYLEEVVKLEVKKKDFNIFEDMISTFSKVPQALTKIGIRAYIVGYKDIEILKYIKISIKAYEEALKVYTLKRFPRLYAMAQNNLGSAYRTLAEVENKAENCKISIKALEEALKVKTLERFPMDYAMAQNNLGTAYGTLAKVEKKTENCKKAIKAYEEALKVYTLKRFPMDYAMAQNNLGNAYRTLAKVENKAENCKISIKALEEALKVKTLERFPMDYAMAQNNLGTAYGTLAEVENKAENCKKAIKAFEEALEVFTKEIFPESYRDIKNNIKILNVFCESE